MTALANAGIAGRGVLLDFYTYAKEKSIEYEPWSQYGITMEQLEDVAKWANITYQKGDIVLIRTGKSEFSEVLDSHKCPSLGLTTNTVHLKVISLNTWKLMMRLAKPLQLFPTNGPE